MPADQNIVHELADRAKRVGWKVTKPRSLNGAYRVFMTPCNSDRHCTHQVYLHLTASDVNTRRSIERAFNAHGIGGLEKKTAERNEKERLAKIEADRKANEALAEEMAKKEQLIAKAAGPYAEPEYVPLEWLTDEHPAPWTRKVILTAKQAQYILDNMNRDNRPLRRATRDHYVHLIEDGRWRLTHQGIAINTEGNLQDGQHRLSAIAKTGQDVPILCTVGAPVENWKAIDEGLQRTAAQAFGKDGIANGGTTSAIIKLVKVHDSGNLARFSDRLSVMEIYDALDGDRPEYINATRYGARNARKMGLSPGALGAARYLLRRENGVGSPFVEAFFRGLSTRRKLDTRLALDERDPREKLREYVANARDKKKALKGTQQLALILIAWNRIIENRRVEYLRFGDSQDIPKIRTIADNSRVPILLDGEVVDSIAGESDIVAPAGRVGEYLTGVA